MKSVVLLAVFSASCVVGSNFIAIPLFNEHHLEQMYPRPRPRLARTIVPSPRSHDYREELPRYRTLDVDEFGDVLFARPRRVRQQPHREVIEEEKAEEKVTLESLESEESQRFERQAGGGGGEHGEHVDYGAHTGHHGAFGWHADFPVHSHDK